MLNHLYPARPDSRETMKATRRRREIVVYCPREWQPAKAKRSEIKEFSGAAGSRLRRTIDNAWCTWRAMWTLTYRDSPTTGPEVKAHLRALWERLRRRGYLRDNAIIWWMEFQARGAVHIHCLTTGYIDYKVIADMWADITGGDPRVCTRVEGLRNPEKAGAYAAKYAAKRDQKVAPDWFTDVGRWWGYVGKRPTRADVPTWARARPPAPEGARKGRSEWIVPRQGSYLGWEAARSSATLAVAMIDAREFAGARYFATENALIFYGSEYEIDKLWEIFQPCQNTQNTKPSSTRKAQHADW